MRLRPADSSSPDTPPEGYPLPEWAAPPEPWGVAPQLRPFYVAAAERGVGSRDAYDRGPVGLIDRYEVSGPRHDGGRSFREPVPYEHWAHNARSAAALQAMRAAEVAAQRAAMIVPCDACGAPRMPGDLRPVNVRDKVAQVCAACLPGTEAAGRRAELLPDGRTRGAAQDALIERLVRGSIVDVDDLSADVDDRAEVAS